MTNDLGKSSRRLKANMPDQDYAVGYGRPPEASRFTKGKSGNPAGRPRGSKNKLPALNEERMKSIILAEAYRTIKIREGDKDLPVSITEAIMRSIAVNAVRGNARAQKHFTDLLAKTENANKQLYDEYLKTAIEYKNGWTNAIERAKELGLPPPNPLPHPDDIEINMQTGQVVMKGPMTPQEQKHWNILREARDEIEKEMAELEARLIRTRSAAKRAAIEEDLAHERYRHQIVIRAVGMR